MLELASWWAGPTHLSLSWAFFGMIFFLIEVLLIGIQLNLRFLVILLCVLVDCAGVSKLARWSNSSIRLPGDQGSEMVALITHNTPWQRFVFVLYWQKLSCPHIVTTIMVDYSQWNKSKLRETVYLLIKRWKQQTKQGCFEQLCEQEKFAFEVALGGFVEQVLESGLSQMGPHRTFRGEGRGGGTKMASVL